MNFSNRTIVRICFRYFIIKSGHIGDVLFFCLNVFFFQKKKIGPKQEQQDFNWGNELLVDTVCSLREN